jgi:hypothetical protein
VLRSLWYLARLLLSPLAGRWTRWSVGGSARDVSAVCRDESCGGSQSVAIGAGGRSLRDLFAMCREIERQMADAAAFEADSYEREWLN